MPLSDLSSSLLCDGVVAKDVRDSVVAVAMGNCTFSEKALAVQNAGGVAVLIISRLSLVPSDHISGKTCYFKKKNSAHRSCNLSFFDLRRKWVYVTKMFSSDC